jgi:hypothetical protein
VIHILLLVLTAGLGHVGEISRQNWIQVHRSDYS